VGTCPFGDDPRHAQRAATAAKRSGAALTALPTSEPRAVGFAAVVAYVAVGAAAILGRSVTEAAGTRSRGSARDGARRRSKAVGHTPSPLFVATCLLRCSALPPWPLRGSFISSPKAFPKPFEALEPPSASREQRRTIPRPRSRATCRETVLYLFDRVNIQDALGPLAVDAGERRLG